MSNRSCMKLTLDRMCISTGKLCGSCTERYNNDEIGDIDIKVGKSLLAASKSQRFLSDITLLNIVTTDESIILTLKKGDKEKIERAGDHFLDNLKKSDLIFGIVVLILFLCIVVKEYYNIRTKNLISKNFIKKLQIKK